MKNACCYALRCLPLLAVLLLAGCGEEEKKYEGPALPSDYKPEQVQPDPVVSIETSMGDMEVELFEDDAPNTVNNFIALCKLPAPFYDGSNVLEVYKDERIAFGKSAGPGWTIPDEITGNPNRMDKYAVVMEDKGAKFCIISGKKRSYFEQNPHTIFGKVVKGTEVIDRMNEAATVDANNNKPKDDIKIKSIHVLKDRGHTYIPTQRVIDPPPPEQNKPQPMPQPKINQTTTFKADEKKKDAKKPDAKPETKKDEKKPADKKEEKK